MKARTAATLVCALCVVPALACGSDDGTGPDPADDVTLIRADGDQQDGVVAEPLPVRPTVEVRDGDGEPMAGVLVRFEVTGGSGSVSPESNTTDVQGRASTSWTLGTSASTEQVLEASSRGETVEFTADARAGAPAQLRIVDGDEQAGEPSSTLSRPLVVQVLDQYDNPVPGVRVTFSTTDGTVDPQQATTDADGRASATATVASSEELSESPQVLPNTLDRGRLTVGYEERLQASQTAEFTASASGLGAVTFQAVLGSSSSTSWSVASGSLPPGMILTSSGDLEGTPTSTGSYPFTVEASTDGGVLADRSYTLEVCEAPAYLEPGQSVSLSPPPSGGCGFFIPSGVGDRYRAGILWATTSTTTQSAGVDVYVERLGAEPGPSPSFASRAAPSGTRSTPTLSASLFEADLERLRATEEAHARIREADARLYSRLGPDAVLPSFGGDPARVAAAAAPVRRVFHEPGSCSETGEVVGKLILETESVIAYQDSVQREDTPVDSAEIRLMSDYYEDYGAPVIDDYFGGVPDIDDNGKLIVLVTPSDAVTEDAAAFVLGRDFQDPATCPASNAGEIAYFSAGVIIAMQESSGVGFQSFQALGTLVHEAKHIASLHHRLQEDGLHPTWIEEGTADIAAELSSRLAWEATGGPAIEDRVLGFTGDPPVTPENWGVLIRMARVAVTLSSQPNAMTTDPALADASHSYYGSSWHFHRFIGDAYYGGMPLDSVFFRRQNESPTRGVAFIEAEIGKEVELLQEEMVLATMANGQDAEVLLEKPFLSYAFPSSAEVFCVPNPLGVYPWTVTTTGDRDQGGCSEGFDPDAESQNPSAEFVDATYEGLIGAGGMRVHDFESDGTGQGIEINADVGSPASGDARLVVVRLE